MENRHADYSGQLGRVTLSVYASENSSSENQK